VDIVLLAGESLNLPDQKVRLTVLGHKVIGMPANGFRTPIDCGWVKVAVGQALGLWRPVPESWLDL
jgi:hypothetical protein